MLCLVLLIGGLVPLDVNALLKDREAEAVRYRDPRASPLAAVARYDLAVGQTVRIGSTANADVKLEGVQPPAMVLKALADGFELDGQKVPPSTKFTLGRYTLRLSHQSFPALMVLDPKSPAVTAGPFPLWFDPDPEASVEAKLEAEPPHEEVILSTRGNKRKALRLGKLHFTLHGQQLTLTALRLLEPGTDEKAVSIFFRDQTTGHESYPVGRYVDAELLPSGSYALDFNRAYNPSCAFSPLYNCPIPPRENQLPVAVRAGERDPGGH
jgi:uncharacterized protein